MQFRPLLALALLAAAPPGVAQAQNPPVTKDAPASAPSASLPSAQQIVDRYVAAIGGRDRIARLQSFQATGTFEMPAQGVRGDLTLAAARPNKVAMRIDIPGMGEVVQGYDGAVAWSVNPMQGPRLLEGKELAQTVEDSDFEGGMLRAATNVVSREVIDQTTQYGEPCYRVRTVKKSGAETTECYSVATGLMVANVSKRESAMGTIESIMHLSEYKDFAGVKVATRNRMQIPAMGAEQVMTFSSFELDAAPASAFARPAAVEALAKQKAP